MNFYTNPGMVLDLKDTDMYNTGSFPDSVFSILIGHGA